MTENPYNPHKDADLEGKPQDDDAAAPSHPATEDDDTPDTDTPEATPEDGDDEDGSHRGP